MIRVQGNAFYCHTNKPNKNSRYNRNRYGAQIIDPEVVKIGKDDDYTADEFLHDFGKEFIDESGVKHLIIQVNNSKFPIPMWDMDNNKLDKAVGVSNGTMIEMAVSVKQSTEYDPYLTIEGVKVLEPIIQFNPFED